MSEFSIRTGKAYSLIPISEIEAVLSEKERILAIVVNRLVVELREQKDIEAFGHIESASWDETLLCFYDRWSVLDIKRHAENLLRHSLLSPFDVEAVIDDYEDFVFFDERLEPFNQLGLIVLCSLMSAKKDLPPTFFTAGIDIARRNEKKRRSKNAKKGHAKKPQAEAKKAIQDEWEKDFKLYSGNKSKFVRESRRKWELLGYILPLTDTTITDRWLPKK